MVESLPRGVPEWDMKNGDWALFEISSQYRER
jgi:hypothetical protein